MTDQSTAPINFRFDAEESFTENCEAFLSSLKDVDPEMAAILIDQWDALLSLCRVGERNLRARSEFNLRVASALDTLRKPAETREGN